MERERDTSGKFSSVKKKSSHRSDYFKWLNEGRKVEQTQAGVHNDHSNYEPTVHNLCNIGAETEMYSADKNASQSWKIGRRIVELAVLAEGLYCCICKSPLHLSNTVGERLYGLGGILLVRCELCNIVTDVQMGKRGPSGSYDINTKASLGMVHTGIGPVHIQNFLAECNLPSISDNTLRKKEKELSEKIRNVTLESCSEAQKQEKSLSNNGKVEASFDGGWQKRGSGWNYNSNTGHATFIGKETGKVLSFDVRSKVCKTCEYHQSRKETAPEHDCSLNWHGSSKAMEADMAVSMAHQLKDDHCEIKVVHADNDAATSARLEMEFQNIQKKDDQNHVKKGISTNLHTISKRYKELQKDTTRNYILRCIMYAITSGNDEEEIKVNLERIVPHVFGKHDLCENADWCSFHEDPEKFVFKSLPNGKPLQSEELRSELDSLVQRLVSRSDSITDLGSTQANESFNQLVSVKAPKSRHYGGSCSLQNRVSAAVLQKNEGYGYLSKVNQAANLSPGEFTMTISKMRNKKKEKRKERCRSKSYKTKRAKMKINRNKHERKHVVKEGLTYAPFMELDRDPTQLTQIPSPLRLDGTESRVFFDLETTGLGKKSDIVQISAQTNTDKKFNRYVVPRLDIQLEASKVTGITFSKATGRMYVHGKSVEPVPVEIALLDFINFLRDLNEPILIGHNICNFDIPNISNKLHEFKLYSTFCNAVKGFIDTLKVAKKYIPKDSVENFKQQTLVHQFVGGNYCAHNAEEDVAALQLLYETKFTSFVKSDDLFSFMYHDCMASYADLMRINVISRNVSILLSKGGISSHHLKLASKRDDNGIKFVLQDHKIPLRCRKSICEHFRDEE